MKKILFAFVALMIVSVFVAPALAQNANYVMRIPLSTFTGPSWAQYTGGTYAASATHYSKTFQTYDCDSMQVSIYAEDTLDINRIVYYRQPFASSAIYTDSIRADSVTLATGGLRTVVTIPGKDLGMYGKFKVVFEASANATAGTEKYMILVKKWSVAGNNK